MRMNDSNTNQDHTSFSSASQLSHLINKSDTPSNTNSLGPPSSIFRPKSARKLRPFRRIPSPDSAAPVSTHLGASSSHHIDNDMDIHSNAVAMVQPMGVQTPPPSVPPSPSFALPLNTVLEPTIISLPINSQPKSVPQVRRKRTLAQSSLSAGDTEPDYSDPVVRSSLPLRYFCTAPRSDHNFGPLTAAGVASNISQKLFQEIRQRRRNRERQRSNKLSLAKSDKERHQIRRNWEESERILREQEEKELVGVRLVSHSSSTASETAQRHVNPKHVSHQHHNLLSTVGNGKFSDDGDGDIMCMSDDELDKEKNVDGKNNLHLEIQCAGDDHLLPSDSDLEDDSSLPRVEIINGVTILRAPQKTIIQSNSQRAEESNIPMQILEESDVRTRYYNQSKHSRGKNNRVSSRWRPDELKLFYQGLSIFGTNFQAISAIIPGKTRVNIRNKYNTELKRNPQEINDALTTTDLFTIEQYSEATGIDSMDLTRPVTDDVLQAANRASQGADFVQQYILSHVPTAQNTHRATPTSSLPAPCSTLIHPNPTIVELEHSCHEPNSLESGWTVLATTLPMHHDFESQQEVQPNVEEEMVMSDNESADFEMDPHVNGQEMMVHSDED